MNPYTLVSLCWAVFYHHWYNAFSCRKCRWIRLFSEHTWHWIHYHMLNWLLKVHKNKWERRKVDQFKLSISGLRHWSISQLQALQFNRKCQKRLLTLLKGAILIPKDAKFLYQRRLYADCANMHTDLSLDWAHMYTDTITKTRLYNFNPLKLLCYIVKLGFIGVYIFFLISA